ncbi:unnamed protein product, partial [Choristocarpus tenellus]
PPSTTCNFVFLCDAIVWTTMKPIPHPSLVLELAHRSRTGNGSGVKLWAERRTVSHRHAEYLDLPAFTTKSTIAVAFSHDGQTFASTHGDHTVKITEFMGGKLLQTLRGHPRTPWTVKYHPRDPRIVASGCLGFEVRVWNTVTGQCLYSTVLDNAIISLSFHPSGKVIAIASGQSVYLWDYHNKTSPRVEWTHQHTLRCVCFTPDGSGVIIGAANNSPTARLSTDVGDRTGGGGSPREVTFRLILWDFNLRVTLDRPPELHALSNPRVVLHRTLLYNDGGFDVSSCGRFLCACAELWKAAGKPLDQPPLEDDTPPRCGTASGGAGGGREGELLRGRVVGVSNPQVV